MYCFCFLCHFQREGTILLAVFDWTHRFIGTLGDLDPFYELFERGGTTLFIYFVGKLCWLLAEVSFYGKSSTRRPGHLDQVILLVWPNL